MIGHRIVVFGATSAIASETLKLVAEREFYLIGRSAERLEIVAQDLRARGAKRVEWQAVDLGNAIESARVAGSIETDFGAYDTVLVAHGDLPDQAKASADFEYAQKSIEVNFLSVVGILTPVANYFESKASGSIIAIGSVAGDRGRQSNYVYGSAKGALAVFLQGLRNRLAKSGVQVLTIKPGFVDTPMTAHLKKGSLFVPAKVVAQGIVKASDNGRDEVYLPWFWSPIMFVIRHIPERIFKRMSL